MTLEGILIGLFAILVGAAFCFSGFKWFLILLPIWGFLAGFVFGSNGIYYLTNSDPGNSFFASALAITVGVVVGVVFAVLSYLYYWFVVILLGASIGYMLGIGFMGLFNFDGFFAWIVGIVVGAVFAYGFMRLHMPAVLAIWGTAVAGAIAIVGGVVLLLGRAPVASLNEGTLGSAINDTQWPWLWIVIAIGLAIAGAFAQIRMIGGMAVAISEDQYKNPGMPAA